MVELLLIASKMVLIMMIAKCVVITKKKLMVRKKPEKARLIVVLAIKLVAKRFLRTKAMLFFRRELESILMHMLKTDSVQRLKGKVIGRN